MQKESWIVFRGTDSWVRFFTKKDFSHVFVLQKDAFSWIALDPKNNNMCATVIDSSVHEDLPRTIAAEDGYRVLRVVVEVSDDPMPRYYLTPINCVTMAEYFCGFRLWCLTPYQLFNRLLTIKAKNKKKGNIISVNQVWSS